MLRRFSTDAGPWHASPTMIPVDPAERSKRRLSEVEGMEGFQLDRDYPDKLTVELEEMGQKANDTDADADEGHDGHDSKKRKTVRRSRRRGDDKARPRGKGRGDKSDGSDGDGEGDCPEGMMAH